MKRILIDGRFVGVGESMTRYVLETLRGVLALDKDNEYTLLIRPQGLKAIKEFFGESGIRNQESGTEFRLPNSKFLIRTLDIPHYSLAEQTKLLNFLKQEKFDLVHFIQFNHPVRYRGKFVVTVHDLTMLGYLHRSNLAKKFAFAQVMKSAVKNSSHILTVSETAKEEIADYYKVKPEKISVVYNGIDHERYNLEVEGEKGKVEGFKKKYGIKGEYLLYTGMWKRHKNVVRMLKAFEEFQRGKGRVKGGESIQLVLVGKKDGREQEVVDEIDQINRDLSTLNFPPSTILTTGYIEEHELPIAYAGALAYIMPSLSEGFGMPPLEALACGTPVISSNVSCMPEILGDAPLYFDPYDVDEMAQAIEKIVTDEKLRAEIVQKGQKQVKKYSWEDTAERTFKVYKDLL